MKSTTRTEPLPSVSVP